MSRQIYCLTNILDVKPDAMPATKETIHIISFQPISKKVGTKIYPLTQCSLSVNECDWHILAGKDERINAHCLTRSNDPRCKPHKKNLPN